jgi:hypothetical protein
MAIYIGSIKVHNKLVAPNKKEIETNVEINVEKADENQSKPKEDSRTKPELKLKGDSETDRNFVKKNGYRNKKEQYSGTYRKSKRNLNQNRTRTHRKTYIDSTQLSVSAGGGGEGKKKVETETEKNTDRAL